MRHFLSLQDMEERDFYKIFALADKLRGKQNNILKNKNILLVFSKPSLRTRVSFQTGISQLGGTSFYMEVDEGFSRGETIEYAANVISRYVNGIIMRWHSHLEFLEFIASSSVPVINALTDLLHPCQAISDMYTIRKKKKKLRGLKIAYIGDGNNNVTHSLMHACSKLGMHMNIACPRKYAPDKEIIKNFHLNSKKSGSELKITSLETAAKDADILYTDTWISMGHESEEERLKIFEKYQINMNLLKNANKDCFVMHCMPVHRGKEITEDVLKSKNSIIFDQAESRLHVEKAILATIFK